MAGPRCRIRRCWSAPRRPSRSLRTETHGQRRRVEQHPVSGARTADHLVVRQSQDVASPSTCTDTSRAPGQERPDERTTPDLPGSPDEASDRVASRRQRGHRADPGQGERLMNLVILVCSSPGTFVPKSRIRQIVGGFGEQSDEAFERAAGPELETRTTRTGHPDTDRLQRPVRRRGTRVQHPPSDFELPEIHLEPDERRSSGWRRGVGSTPAWPRPPAEPC